MFLKRRGNRVVRTEAKEVGRNSKGRGNPEGEETSQTKIEGREERGR